MSSPSPVEPTRTGTEIDGVVVVRFPRVEYNDSVLVEAHRAGWTGLFDEPIEHLCHIRTRRGVVRPWGRHTHTTDRYVAIDGAMEVALYDDRSASPSRGTVLVVQLESDQGVGLLIPAGIWHTFRAVSDTAILLNAKHPPYNAEQVDKETRAMPSDSIPFTWSAA